MIDMTTTYLMTYFAIILVALAVTAFELRRISSLRSRRSSLSLQTAREVRPALLQRWRAR